MEKIPVTLSMEKVFALALKYIDDSKQSKEFLDEYLRCIKEANPTFSDAMAQARASDNLGYWAGYYSTEVRKKMNEVYGAVHPIFGNHYDDLTPELIEKLSKEDIEKKKKAGII